MRVDLRIGNPKPGKPIKAKGKTYDEVAAFLENLSYIGCYDTNASYNYAKDDNLIVTSVTIIARPTIAMITWSGSSKLKGQEKKNWDAMIRALARHEAEHHKIFTNDAKAFKRNQNRVNDLHEDDLPEKMQTFFAESQKRQDAFDTRTGNGSKTGVVLPPVN